MIVLKYIITFVLGIISTTFVSSILTILNCGISACKNVPNCSSYTELEKKASKKLLKKYYLSLFIDFLIILSITLIVHFLIHECIIFYLVYTIIYSLYVFFSGATAKNEQNMSEFYNALQSNIDYNNPEPKEIDKEIITELMNKSGLSENICTDIYSILSSFQYESKEKGLEKIKTLLIPDLRNEGNYGNVGIAFGMLINDEIGLTKEESIKYASDFMLEMVGEKNEST